MRKKVVSLVIFLSLLWIGTSWADAPQLINFQGRLTDSLGNPVSDGSYSLRFRIYDDSLAGNVLWEETDPVQITKGLFTVLLGSTSSIPESSFYAANRWLGIKVGANPEIIPRQRLTSVGYSFQSGQWTSSGNDLYRTSGNVGIGTSSPSAKLDVSGMLLVNPTNSFVGINRSTQVSGAEYFGVLAPVSTGSYGGMYISTGGNDGSPFYGYATLNNIAWTYLDGQTGDWKLYNGGDRMTVAKNGKVGIGAAPHPAFKLYVENAAEGALAGYYTGSSIGYWGVYGSATGSFGKGVYAENPGGGGWAGYFYGNVYVDGTLAKAAGAFKIDHPLDPANKYLYHSFVESPDMKNIYDGVITTDANGNALVTLPNWFGALNRDFRYQLTVLGEFAQAIISKEISNNEFSIKTDKPNVKVSWQVTGIRQDAYANAHRIPVEEEKIALEKGYYLHPQLFGLSEEKQIEWAHNPEMMKQMKEKREQEAKQINSQ